MSNDNSKDELKSQQIIQELYDKTMTKQKLHELQIENENIKTQCEKENNELRIELKKQRDVIWYLNREIKNKDELITQLHDDLHSLKTQINVQKNDYENTMEDLCETHDKATNELEKKFRMLQDRYDQISNFVQHKDNLVIELEECQNKMIEAEEEHQRIVNDLERRNVSEKNRLKKEMMRKVKETKMSLLAMTQDQLHETTKRTIMENEQISNELRFQSIMTEKMLQESDALKQENIDLKRQLELQEEAEKMLATRTSFFQKVIKKLNAKIKELEIDGISTIHHNQKRKTTTPQQSPRISQELEERLLKKSREVDRLKVELQNAQIEIQKHKRAHRKIILSQDETVTFVLACLQDIKRKQSIHAINESRMFSNGSKIKRKSKPLNECSLEERENILNQLLNKLAVHPELLNNEEE